MRRRDAKRLIATGIAEPVDVLEEERGPPLDGAVGDLGDLQDAAKPRAATRTSSP